MIVNLGCGLDTSFSRVDNGCLTWIDIDLPDVIELRKKLLPPSAREHYIAKSALDYSWMSEVKKHGEHIFVFAGGLFMYFSSDQMRSTLVRMAQEFPNSHLMFDNIYPKGMKRANAMLEKSSMNNALLQWSIYNANILEQWSSDIKVVYQHGYFKNIKNKRKFPLTSKIAMPFFDLVHKSGIIYLKFYPNSTADLFKWGPNKHEKTHIRNRPIISICGRSCRH